MSCVGDKYIPHDSPSLLWEVLELRPNGYCFAVISVNGVVFAKQEVPDRWEGYELIPSKSSNFKTLYEKLL